MLNWLNLVAIPLVVFYSIPLWVWFVLVAGLSMWLGKVIF